VLEEGREPSPVQRIKSRKECYYSLARSGKFSGKRKTYQWRKSGGHHNTGWAKRGAHVLRKGVNLMGCKGKGGRKKGRGSL